MTAECAFELVGESGDGIAYGKDDLDWGTGVGVSVAVLPELKIGLIGAVGVAWPLTALTTLLSSSSVSFCRLASASWTCLRIRIWIDNYSFSKRQI